MSMEAVEREIVAALRTKLCNKKLRQEDLLEWSTGDVSPGEYEVVVEVEALDTTWQCCVPQGADKRKKTAT